MITKTGGWRITKANTKYWFVWKPYRTVHVFLTFEDARAAFAAGDVLR